MSSKSEPVPATRKNTAAATQTRETESSTEPEPDPCAQSDRTRLQQSQILIQQPTQSKQQIKLDDQKIYDFLFQLCHNPPTHREEEFRFTPLLLRFSSVGN